MLTDVEGVGVDFPLAGVSLLKGFGVEEEEDEDDVGGILVMLILGFDTGVEVADTDADELDPSAGFSFFGAGAPPSFASRCARIWGWQVSWSGRLVHYQRELDVGVGELT